MSNQPPDIRPGNYYVSVVDGKRHALLLGPFAHHVTALDAVDDVRRLAHELDPRAAWYAFGTCRLPDDDSVPVRAGSLNARFNL